MSVMHFYPALAAALWFCAISVGLGRRAGMHFLSDVIPGATTGGLLGSGSFWTAASLAR